MLDHLRSLLPHKLRAVSVHFLLSLAIFAALLYLILFHWYPGPWFAIDGGWPGVRIMVGVDLVLGPFLTFLVFNPNKTRLALGIDFSFIALVQITALAWGIYTVHGQRPLAVVYWDGAFHSVDAKSAGFKDQPKNLLDTFGSARPVIVFQQEPESKEKKLELMMAMFASDQAEYEHPELYRPLEPHLAEVFAQQVDIKKLNEQSPQAVQQLLHKFPELKPKDFRYVSFDGRYEMATLVFKPDGTLIGHLPPLAPPPPAAKSSPPAKASS